MTKCNGAQIKLPGNAPGGFGALVLGAAVAAPLRHWAGPRAAGDAPKLAAPEGAPAWLAAPAPALAALAAAWSRRDSLKRAGRAGSYLGRCASRLDPSLDARRGGIVKRPASTGTCPWPRRSR